MKPITPRPHWWTICLLFLALMPALISCKDEKAHERLAAIEHKLDQLAEKETAAGRVQPLFTITGKKTKKIKIKKNNGRNRIEVCLKANADWSVIDSIVVDAKHKRVLSTPSRHAITLTAAEPEGNFTYKDKKENSLHLIAQFYSKGRAIEGDWCDQNGTDCKIPAEQKCSDSNVPIASVKSTAASGNSVTVSVDEQ